VCRPKKHNWESEKIHVRFGIGWFGKLVLNPSFSNGLSARKGDVPLLHAGINGE